MFAFFDVIPTEFIDEEIYYFPDEQPYSIGFQTLGYESLLFLGNAGFALWLVWGHLFLIVIFLITFKVNFIRKHLGKYLFWGTLIRLFSECYFEMVMLALLNFKIAVWDSPFPSVKASNAIACILLLTAITVPLFLLCFYLRRKDNWSDERFQETHGTLFEGLKIESKVVSKKMIVLYIMSFFLRRVAFVMTVIFMQDYIWFALCVQMYFTFGLLVLLFTWKPLEDKREFRVEVFNELTILLLSYTLISFTNFIHDAEFKNTVGYAYITVSFANIGTHLSLLLYDSG